MSKVAELKKEMIQCYGELCWMNEMWIPTRNNILTFHHIIEVRNGGKLVWENGALLSNASHQYLNYLDHYFPDTYKELNGMFYDLNRTYLPPTPEYYDEVRRLIRKIDIK